jgi:YVTN family beta-propeller protein
MGSGAHRRAAAVLLAAAMIATGCSAGSIVSSTGPTGTAGGTTTIRAAIETTVPEASESTSTTVATSTTTTSTTVPVTASTTTVPPVRYRIDITTHPATTRGFLGESSGAYQPVFTPFSGDVSAGPATLTVRAAGYNDLTVDFDATTDITLDLYLDPPGQLLHKLTVIPTGNAPKQVAFTPNGTELWVTLLAGSGFEVYDPATGELLGAIDLPDAGSVEVIFNRSGSRAYVSQMETASVYEIDVVTREVLRRMSTDGVWTKVMVLSPDETMLYASNWVSDDVSEIDLATGEVVRRLPTVDTPRGLYVTPDGDRLFVAGFEDGELQVIDLETGAGEVVYRGGRSLRHIVGDTTGSRIYVSDLTRDHVLVVDPVTDEVEVLTVVDRKPNTVALSPDGTTLFVSCRGRNNPESYYLPGPQWGSVVVLDAATGAYLDAIVGGNQPTGLAVSPDGTLLATSDFLDDRVTIYQVPPYDDLVAGGGGRWGMHRTELEK